MVFFNPGKHHYVLTVLAATTCLPVFADNVLYLRTGQQVTPTRPTM
jgi:hypothetical protein